MPLAKYVTALSGTRLGRPSQVSFPPGKRMREGVLFLCLIRPEIRHSSYIMEPEPIALHYQSPHPHLHLPVGRDSTLGFIIRERPSR